MADLSISLGVETAGLDKAMASARAGIDGLKKAASGKGLFAGIESQVSSLQGKFSGVFQNLRSGNILGAFAGAEGMGMALGGVAVAAGTVAAAVGGMWNAMSRGKELTMLGEQTNLTVPQLMALEKVVGRVGMSMDELPMMMGKFNTAMTELADPSSKTAQALAKIKLNAASFQGKSYYEGLKTLAKGMGEATNATDKMAAAQAVFGARKGNLMVPVMKEGAFAKAEANVSPAAQVYEQNGVMFAQFQAAVGRLGMTLQPFFAGMASEVVPGLLKSAEGFEKIDLTQAGKSFGAAIKDAVVFLNDAVAGMMKLVDKVETVTGKGTVGKVSSDAAAQIAMGPLGGLFKLYGAIKNRNAKPGEEGAPTELGAAPEAPPPAVIPPTIDLSGTQKSLGMPALIASSFTKIGAGGQAWGGGAGDAMMSIQREQLSVQQRMANALERQLANERQTGMGYDPSTTPLLGD
jgi:hypothetical protein